jgi:hypothetical protein
MKNPLTVSAAVVLAFCTFFVSGCSDGKIATEQVTGTITYDGSPLDGATVNFSPKTEGQGSPSYAMTDASGNYKLQTLLGNPDAGTTPGEYIVTVQKTEKIQSPSSDLSGPSAPPAPVKKPKSLIPELYGTTLKSPLTATVNKGKNTINFELKSKP